MAEADNPAQEDSLKKRGKPVIPAPGTFIIIVAKGSRRTA